MFTFFIKIKSSINISSYFNSASHSTLPIILKAIYNGGFLQPQSPLLHNLLFNAMNYKGEVSMKTLLNYKSFSKFWINRGKCFISYIDINFIYMSF